jgi:heat shock protein HslJ
MKKVILLLPIAIQLISSCTTSKLPSTTNTLEGTWQLKYITGPRIAFNGLFPENKPTITFDLKESRVSGNNSCNDYSGSLIVKGNQINFKDSKMIATMMACQGKGEQVFMSTLGKINTYSISEDGKILNFIMGDIAMMRFEKITTDTHNSKNATDWKGTYKGITPCADCEGIATEVILNNDQTYIIKTKYIGKDNEKVFKEKGTFTWDKTGTTIIFNDFKGKPNQYKVVENKLIQLDMKGKIITGALAEKYVLIKYN